MEIYMVIYLLSSLSTLLCYFILQNKYEKKVKKLQLKFIEEDRLLKQKIEDLKE